VIEGDTVYQAARRLDAALSGRVLTGSVFRDLPYAALDLSRCRVGSVVSRGKHVLIRVGRLCIYTNLGLGGRWEAYAPGERSRTPLPQATCVLRNADFLAAGFDLGFLRVIRASDEPVALRHMGPDPLGHSWDPVEAARRLVLDPDRPIGLALLDQRLIAGIGDVYRSEVLAMTHTNPHTPTGLLEDLPRLVDVARELLNSNKDRARRLTAPRSSGERHWVYGRAGLGCLRCGSPVVQGTLGKVPRVPRRAAPAAQEGTMLEAEQGDFEETGGRHVFWCPQCQPAADGT
jgi:endonuclease-8